MAMAVIMPQQGQSVESCILVEWLVPAGESVTRGQILANIETDKALFELEAPCDGTLLEHFFSEGEDIPVLTPIGAIGKPGEDVADLRPASKQPEAADTPPEPSIPPAPQPITPTTPTPSPSSTVPGISPRARHAAKSSGIDTTHLTGSGPDGRIIEQDIQTARNQAPRISPAAREQIEKTDQIAPKFGSGPGSMILSNDLQEPSPNSPAADQSAEEIPITGVRKIIAERMHHSLASTAQLTLSRRADATALLQFYQRAKENGEHFGLPRLTVNDLVVYATIRTLCGHSNLNAHFLEDRIVHYPAVHLGIAVDTPRGLMVPVLRDANSLSLSDIANAIRPLAEACQSGKIRPDQLTGGTFTITNLGALGIESFTPILNPPEVAILGVGAITLSPERQEDRIKHIDSLHLNLTINHQAVDGAPAAQFLRELTNNIENFTILAAT